MASRRGREFTTIGVMLRLYCRAHHHPRGRDLCPECVALRDYARARLEHCRFGETKPTCALCPVHCYRAVQREKIRQIMRWSGPRMAWRHPVLAVRHMIDGWRSPASQ